jgi:hypothetical protein
MTFTEKMAVWTLVLDYLKVILGYPVTIPVLVGFLCWLFRERIRAAIDRIRALRFKDASMDLAALVDYGGAVERSTSEETEQSAAKALSQSDQETIVGALAALFKLSASTLPLIPKAERQRFIAESMKGLPPEFGRFRRALEKLADKAPEVSTVHARDLIITPPTGTMRMVGADARVDDVPPAPKV